MPLDLARQVGELQGSVTALQHNVVAMANDVRRLLDWTVRHESADNTRAADVKEAVQRRRGTLLFFAGGVGSVVTFALERIANKIGWLCLALILFAPGAAGAPPENADPALAPWFHSLHSASGAFCCDQSDGRATEHVRVANDGSYSALIDERWNNDPPAWVPVPKGAVLERADNPTGRFIVFWTPQLGVICLVRPSDS